MSAKVFKILKLPLDYLFGGIYIIYFCILICVFHVIQYVAFEFMGQAAHQKTVEWLNFWIVKGCIITGSTSELIVSEPLPTDRTIIFVANHQSMFDICGIVWYLRKHTPLFVSKKELAKGIPSISYNLRVGHAALIDRKDSRQAISEIIRFANYIYKNKFSGVIFPEGTRSRTGVLKPFAVGGVATLIKKCPDALLVPLAVRNTGRFNPTGIFPLKTFVHMSWTTLKPLEVKNNDPEHLVKEAETQISDYLKKFL
jgi:1-acyl-sn-glycerol-3-phosphate acyltransferase